MSQPVYFQNVHTQSTAGGSVYVTIQLPVTPSGQVGLWEFCGYIFELTAGDSAGGTVLAFGNASGFTVNTAAQIFYQSFNASTASGWSTDLLSAPESPMLFKPDANGRAYARLVVSSGTNNTFVLTTNWRKVKGSSVATSA